MTHLERRLLNPNRERITKDPLVSLEIAVLQIQMDQIISQNIHPPTEHQASKIQIFNSVKPHKLVIILNK